MLTRIIDHTHRLTSPTLCCWKLTDFILHQLYLLHLIFQHILYFLNLTLKLIKLAVSISVVTHGKSCYEINDSFFVLDWMYPPVVHYELKLRYLPVWIGNFCVDVEGLAHDGNQHVQHMDAHEEGQQDEQDGEDRSHGVVGIILNVEFTECRHVAVL